METHLRNPKLASSLYGYIPTRWVCIVFLVLFSLSTCAHVGQAVYFRTWWLLLTVVVCGILEVAGWSARLWSSWSPRLSTPYEMQLTCTIIGPTPLVAANFVILGTIIKSLGTEFSRIAPKWYAIIFCTCDVIALFVQGIGGGVASAAVAKGKNPETGGHIMLGGIIFQLAVITLYVACAVEFFVRWHRNAPLRNSHQVQKRRGVDARLKIMTAAVLSTSLLLWIRAVYRTIELVDGFTGEVITTQIYFNVLDGMMVLLAMYTFNFAHPGLLLRSYIRAVDTAAEKQ